MCMHTCKKTKFLQNAKQMQHLIELSLSSTSWSQATAKRFSPSWSRFGCFKSWNSIFYLDLVLWSLVFKWGAWNDLPDVIIVRRKHESFQHCLFLFFGWLFFVTAVCGQASFRSLLLTASHFSVTFIIAVVTWWLLKFGSANGTVFIFFGRRQN